jgi:hypothetical protein
MMTKYLMYFLMGNLVLHVFLLLNWWVNSHGHLPTGLKELVTNTINESNESHEGEM